MSDDGIRHGISGYTNDGCRCTICSTASREYGRKYRAEHPEVRVATMLRGRRLRAMARKQQEYGGS